MERKISQKYILVTGGELMNKGAQAMSFITVDQMARRYPDYKVVLFSSADARRRSDAEKSNYKFEILPFPGLGESVSLCTGLLKRRYLKRENGKNFSRYKDIFTSSVALLDISGYALGSKWNDSVIETYLRRIFLATHFHIPVYLMPQSFGPFDFKSRKSKRFHRLLKRYLSKAKLIMARENDGMQKLTETYGLNNVIKTPDMVLQNKDIHIENIYYCPPKDSNIDIKVNSVAIIPNSKNNKFGSETANLKFYQEAIGLLLEHEKNVCLIYHAIEDLEICQKIKDFFTQDERVRLIAEELSCIAFDEIVEKFDFVIASRYHSIVHAYRKGIPSVILGWAVKYRELASVFDQQQYCFDASNIETVEGNILTKIDQMCALYSQESQKISHEVEKIQSSSVFDFIQINDVRK